MPENENPNTTPESNGSRSTTISIEFCTDWYPNESTFNICPATGDCAYGAGYGAGWIGSNACYTESLDLEDTPFVNTLSEMMESISATEDPVATMQNLISEERASGLRETTSVLPDGFFESAAQEPATVYRHPVSRPEPELDPIAGDEQIVSRPADIEMSEFREPSFSESRMPQGDLESPPNQRPGTIDDFLQGMSEVPASATIQNIAISIRTEPSSV